MKSSVTISSPSGKVTSVAGAELQSASKIHSTVSLAGSVVLLVVTVQPPDAFNVALKVAELYCNTSSSYSIVKRNSCIAVKSFVVISTETLSPSATSAKFGSMNIEGCAAI